MAEFPEWNAGEIVEDDVGDFLDARSARAAKIPVQPRRQGRVPPKKNINRAASPKAVVSVVPLVQCQSLEDDLAAEGLMGSPPPLNLDTGRVARSAPPPRRSAAPVPSSEPLRRCASRALMAMNPTRANTNAPSPKQPPARSASVAAPSTTATPPPTAPPPKQLLPASSKHVRGNSLSSVSVSSGDNGTTSECDSVSKGTAARPLLPGYKLPIICRVNAPGERDELRKPYSADVPAPLHNKIASRAVVSACDPGSPRSTLAEDEKSRPLVDGPVPPSPTSRTYNPRATVREPPAAKTRSQRSSLTIDTAGALSGDTLRRSRGSMYNLSPKGRQAQRSSHPSFRRQGSIRRQSSIRRPSVGSRTDLKKSLNEYSFGELLERTAMDHSRTSLAVPTTRPTMANSVASSANYSVLRTAFEASVQALDKSNGVFALPRMESSVTKLHRERHGSNLRPSSRAPAENGLASTRNRSFYSNRSFSKPPVNGPAHTAKPTATAPAPAARTGGGGPQGQEYDLGNVEVKARRAPQTKRALRRRSAEFGEA